MARRYKQLDINLERVTDLLRAGRHPGWEVVDYALPEDVRIVAIDRHPHPTYVTVTLESEEWPETVPGTTPLRLPQPQLLQLALPVEDAA